MTRGKKFPSKTARFSKHLSVVVQGCSNPSPKRLLLLFALFSSSCIPSPKHLFTVGSTDPCWTLFFPGLRDEFVSLRPAFLGRWASRVHLVGDDYRREEHSPRLLGRTCPVWGVLLHPSSDSNNGATCVRRWEKFPDRGGKGLWNSSTKGQCGRMGHTEVQETRRELASSLLLNTAVTFHLPHFFPALLQPYMSLRLSSISSPC